MIYFESDKPFQICIDPDCGDWPLFYLFGLAELDAEPVGFEEHIDWIGRRNFTPHSWLSDHGSQFRARLRWPEPSGELKQRWRNFYDRNKGMTLPQVIAGIEIFLDQWDLV
jgi:hypothetical protein